MAAACMSSIMLRWRPPTLAPPFFQLARRFMPQCRTVTTEIIRQRSLNTEVRDRTAMAESLLPRLGDRQDLARSIARVSECARRRDAAGALELLGQVENPNVSLHNAVLNACAKACEFERARDLWASMPEKDRVSYNTMIGICGSSLRIEYAEDLWHEMLQNNVQPDIVTYTTMIKAYGQSGNADGALRMLNSLKAVCAPDSFAFAAAMSACARIGDYARARELFVEMTSAGIAPRNPHVNSLLTACAKRGDSTTAEAIFQLMPAYNLKPREMDYTILIACCRHNVSRSRELLKEMQEMQAEPSIYTYQQLVHSEVKAGNWEQAAVFLSDAKKRDSTLTPILRKLADQLESRSDTKLNDGGRERHFEQGR